MRIPAGYSETITTAKASRRIEAFWSFTATTQGQSLVLPDGRCDLIVKFHADDRANPTPIITGPATQSYLVTYAPGDCWIGARMRPEGGAMLWRSQINEAVDRVLRGGEAQALVPELADLQGDTLTQIHLERLVDTIARVESISRPPPVVQRAIETLHVTGGRLPVGRLAVYVGCTTRHLNRLFQANVGLSAKTYAQLVQFQRSLRLIKENGQSVSAAAHEGGYADQPHLTRAFRRFGGFSPHRLPGDLALPKLFPL